MDSTAAARILAHYDIGRIGRIDPLDCDPNRPWKVSADSGDFVLREHRLCRSADEIAFQTSLPGWLIRRGYPTACVLPTADGAAWAEDAGKAFSLYGYLAGNHFAPGDRAQAQSAGACLARFHDVASHYEDAASRRPPGRYRTTAIDAAVIGERWPDRGEAMWLLEELARVDEESRAAPLPEALCFNDFAVDNVVFEGTEVSGVFDLECCFWGPRLADLAASVMSFAFTVIGRQGTREKEIRFDLGCARTFFRGYGEIAALSEIERQLLPTAVARQIRRDALFDMVDIQQPGHWHEHEWEFSKRQIELVDASCHSLFEQ